MAGLETIAECLQLLAADQRHRAESLVVSEFPHEPVLQTARRYTPLQCMQIFIRDGFVDRYSGERLLYPGTLRVLSLEFPDSFPYHRNWKMSETHIAYWQLYPTIDHIIPVARGGTNDPSNLVTTSQLRNSAKSHWLLEEVGWTLHPAGDISAWDGLLGATTDYVEQNPHLMSDKVLKNWHRAAQSALE